VFQDRGDEYRAWEAQCRAMAVRAKTDEDRRPWLELADKWRRLAQQANGAQQAQQPQPDENSAKTSN
jgi:hypothetical protein